MYLFKSTVQTSIAYKQVKFSCTIKTQCKARHYGSSSECPLCHTFFPMKLLRALENRQQFQGNEGDSNKSERTPPC